MLFKYKLLLIINYILFKHAIRLKIFNKNKKGEVKHCFTPPYI